MAKIIRVWDGTQWQVVGTALPDALTVDGIQTLTNKSIALGSNTITGTTAQFNTALTDGNFATLAGSETLTNKTISGTDNTLSNIPNNALSNSSITINGSAVSLGGSTTINALPSQTSNSGKYLTTDGSSASWANVTNLVPTDSNISVPGVPTSVTAVEGNAQATVSFSVPSDNGGSTILGYTIISNPGNIKKSTTLTSATVTGLTNGTAYTFTVKAHNIAGTSVASSASSAVTPNPVISVDYLVVAGGGGGGRGNGGGGGAGGLRSTVTATGGGGSLESPVSLLLNTAYTVEVGAGGAGNTIGIDNHGFPGGNSVISTVTSTGGGRGGGYNTENGAGAGGSGGGAGTDGTYQPSTINVFSGGAGTSGQGFNGGSGGINRGGDNGWRTTGGGGGAGSAGGNGGTPGSSGNGGNGVSVSITGSSVTYAGGGGGGVDTNSGSAGTGGSGGGANGAKGGSGAAATVNTGGGGGGGGNVSGDGGAVVNGGNGGSGIVILRSTQAASATTGSPTITTSGGYHIYQFNNTGSITF